MNLTDNLQLHLLQRPLFAGIFALEGLLANSWCAAQDNRRLVQGRLFLEGQNGYGPLSHSQKAEKGQLLRTDTTREKPKSPGRGPLNKSADPEGSSSV